MAPQASLLVLMAAVLAVPITLQQESAPVRLVDGGTRVELDLADAPLDDVLAAAQPILGVTLNFEPADTANIRLHEIGVRRVDRAAFRDEFDAVLKRYDFWTFDNTTGGAPVVQIIRATFGRFSGFGGRCKPLPISLDELVAGPARHAPLYSVVFPIARAPARDVIIVLQPLLDTTFESVRAVDSPNEIVVNGSREHLLAIRDTLSRIDVPGPDEPTTLARVTALEKAMDGVSKRVAALEADTGH